MGIELLYVSIGFFVGVPALFCALNLIKNTFFYKY
jgi:hypothetical protein